MTVTATYKVTAGHLARGERGKCARCPVALAIAATGLDDVSVDALHAQARTTNGQWVRARMPGNASRAVGRIDRGKRVEPFSFTLVWSEVEPGTAVLLTNAHGGAA